MLPLHLACEDGDPVLISLLLARGAQGTPATPTRPKRVFQQNGGTDASAPPPVEPMSPGSPSPMSARRKQMLEMQKASGNSAIFIARNHEHHEAVALLQRAASGEAIPMPDLERELSLRAEISQKSAG